MIPDIETRLSRGNWEASVITKLELDTTGLHIAVTAPHDKPGKVKIVALCGKLGEPEQDESIANSYLLSTAKEMLKALRSIQVGTSPESFAQYTSSENIGELFKQLHEIATVAIAQTKMGL